jgi:cell division protein FtsI/penicillin-binding protein 2/cell division protein FtsW (lipid II flippase)
MRQILAWSPRALERRLLLSAALLGGVGLADVHLSLHRGEPWTPVLVGAGALLSFLVVHGVLAASKPDVDQLLLPLVAAMTSVSLVMIYRLKPLYLVRQSAWIILGLAALVAVVALMSDLRWVGRYAYLCGAAALLLLVVTVVAGVEVNGARRWLLIRGVTFEPGEIVKVLLVAFFAGILAEASEGQLSTAAQRWRMELARLGPLLTVCAGALLLVVFQRDVGLAMLYYGIFLAMLYAATGRAGYLVMGLVAFLAGAAVCYQLFPHVRVRFDVWLDPWRDPAGRAYQIVQALYALGSGGLLGSGLGGGHPEFIPEVHTDMIAPAIGEELGYAGISCVIVLYLLLLARTFRIAVRAGDPLAALVATGVSAGLALQALILLGGSTRLTPLTGIPAPFLSYGGSAAVSDFIAVALLLGISAHHGARSAGAVEPDRRRVARLAAVLTAGFLVLWGYLALVQLVWGARLADAPENPRLAIAAQRVHWGRILDRRLRVLADSTVVGGRRVRRYPDGRLYAHVLGYRSQQYGLTGIEARFNAALVGAGARDAWTQLLDVFGRPPQGNDVVLTIDATVQQAAVKALGGRRGAVVVLDPPTGAVIALASIPDFAPDAVDAQWSQLTHDAGAPLLGRATQGQYPPGSAFKPITLTAGLASGRVTDATSFECPGSISVAGATISDFEGKAHGHVALPEAFTRSCNVSFVQVGLRTGADAIVATARAFGLGRAPRFELPAAAGHLPDPGRLGLRSLAQISFGQGELLVTPLQMALLAATVANGGVAMEPMLTAQVRAPDGHIVTSFKPRGSRQAIPPTLAMHVAQYMLGVVQSGTGAAAQIPGIPVAGKTGTAENPHGRTHAWFIGFAPVGRPTVAVAVVLENAGVGGEVAAPAARDVLQAALAAQSAGPSKRP